MEENREKMEEERMEDFVNHNVLVRGAPHGTWENSDKKKHFVLVHGAGQGAWGWYKVSTMLESAGYKVTKVDMAASGINMTEFSEVKTFADYTAPLLVLMASLHSENMAILVGQSFGGINIALAMDEFPEKVLCGVFVNAFMPDCTNQPSYVLTVFFRTLDSPMDCRFTFDQGPESPPTSVLFGPNFLSSKLYQNCQPKDHTLATMLVRPSSMYVDDISNESMLSEENYGSVGRVYIVCKEDKLMNIDFQRWIIKNNPVKEVKEIEQSDHMAMLSKPQELCLCLLEIAEEYA
ncbi:polyneuridine aldehyde esterase-like [Tasmannia lanceolata]|uniref:polyneuridine aldehyde esterase-like n=1 Tax=Tasmannia lanceolata TaxID=3420 RepID=UPI0040637410